MMIGGKALSMVNLVYFLRTMLKKLPHPSKQNVLGYHPQLQNQPSLLAVAHLHTLTIPLQHNTFNLLNKINLIVIHHLLQLFIKHHLLNLQFNHMVNPLP
jgi:hypothetical protein